MIFQIILTFHILIAIGLVALILMQHGKGASAGAAFGSGSSNSVFGASGANSFLFKLTRLLGIAFFSTSIALAYIASNEANPETVEIESIIQTTDVPEVPVVPALSNDSEVPTLNQ